MNVDTLQTCRPAFSKSITSVAPQRLAGMLIWSTPQSSSWRDLWFELIRYADESPRAAESHQPGAD